MKNLLELEKRIQDDRSYVRSKPELTRPHLLSPKDFDHNLQVRVQDTCNRHYKYKIDIKLPHVTNPKMIQFYFLTIAHGKICRLCSLLLYPR